jgi:DNA-binding PadR family transcriptional regulator
MFFGRKDRVGEILLALQTERWTTGEQIKELAQVPPSSVFPTIGRMIDGGLVGSRPLEKQDRRGRRGREYQITKKGLIALEAYRAYVKFKEYEAADSLIDKVAITPG